MANQRPADTLEQHQHEVINAFSRAAVAMRDAASTAESFSNWFSRVNNLQNVSVPPMFNGGVLNFVPTYGGPQQQYPAETPVAGKKRKALDDPDGKKKKKEKKPKDPNAPKRPPSPYLLFQNEIRKSIQAQHPNISYGQILTEIAKIWKEMSPEEKAPYQASQAMMKAKFEQDKAEYEAPHAENAAAATPVAKAPTPAPAVSKSVTAVPAATSDDSSDESTEPSSSDDEDEDDEGEAEPAPEPPRKKSKKEPVKLPTPPPAKAGKKKEKSVEGKKKKKTVDT